MKRITQLLGLCMRAGGVLSGEKACVQAIRAGQAYVALLDGAAAGNARKSLGDACRSHDVPLIELEADSLGYAIGKPGRMAAVVTNEGFAKRLIELAAEME